MNISDLAGSHATLIKLTGFQCEETSGLEGLVFLFEGHKEKMLIVNPEDDSLRWQDTKPAGCKQIALENLFPRIKEAYGLHLIWTWEMTNQQGYFDAVQIQLADVSLKNEITFQFKTAASKIAIFEVLKVSR